MAVLHFILVIIQFIAALLMILIVASQTTKSEQGGGMGWGTIGGQVQSSIHKFGLESQITRVTTWTAIGFFVLSFLAALVEARLKF